MSFKCFRLSGMFSACMLLACVELASSQNVFKEGYIIKNNLDTVNGKIKDVSDIDLQSVCIFTTQDENNVTSYSPEEIYGFRISDGRIFYSKTLPESMGGTKIFLESLILGRYSLYGYAQTDHKEYFIADDQGTLKLLENDVIMVKLDYKNYSKLSDGGTYNKNSIEYIKTLRLLFANYPELLPKIDQTPYKQSALVNLVKEIHSTLGEDYKTTAISKPFFEYSSLKVYGGLLGGKVSINYEPTDNDKYLIDPSLNLGAEVEIKLSRISSNVFLKFGVDVSFIHYANEFDYKSVNQVVKSHYERNASFISAGPTAGIKYIVKGKTYKPYFSLTGHFLSFFKYENTSTQHQLSPTEATYVTHDIPLPDGIMNLTGEAGCNIYLTGKSGISVSVGYGRYSDPDYKIATIFVRGGYFF